MRPSSQTVVDLDEFGECVTVIDMLVERCCNPRVLKVKGVKAPNPGPKVAIRECGNPGSSLVGVEAGWRLPGGPGAWFLAPES